jgi:eukaryotic-like serine/threonine-protein kinase
MATVYLARREIVAGAWREFALKLLHPQLRAEPSLSDQLLAEARLVAAIRHRNVVQVIEAGERAEAVYLVMEYVEGDTLAGLIRNAIHTGLHIPVPIVGRIVLDGLLGLHAAHEAKASDGHPLGLVHRDFSPQNLLVGRDGVTRLTDFGIAKVMHRIGATATGIVKGKVSYMAPEQARGERLDRRCDVWAAGVVLWEALASQRLFSGANDAALVLEIVAGRAPRRVSSVRREVGAALDDVVAAALERSRHARIGDAEELRRRVEAALADHGIADTGEVARYVEQATGDKLERRREAVTKVTGLRRQLDTLSEAATRESLAASGMTPAPPPEVVVDLGGLTGETAVSSDLVIAPRRRRRGPWLIAALVSAVTGAAAWTVFEERPSVATSHFADAAASGERTAKSEAPSRVAPTSLRVRADAPVAQIHVGKRSVALPDPRADFEVPLTAEERGAPLSITFVAADRRRVSVQVGASDEEVSVLFPRAAGRRPAPRARKEKTGPDIVADPYGGP